MSLEGQTEKLLLPGYHHARPFEYCPYSDVRRTPNVDTDFEGAYQWLEGEVGFPPTFLAVGTTETDIRMTGYQTQWKRVLSRSKETTVYKKKGEIDNQVLFSFYRVPLGIFMDYTSWHIVLNSGYKNYNISRWAKKLIFRPTWNKDRWLEQAERRPHSVQYVVPELDLRQAGVIWVRNKQTQEGLHEVGFRNIQIKRLVVDKW